MRLRVKPGTSPAKGIDLYLFEERQGKAHAANPITVADQPVEDLALQPSTSISEAEAAQLMTDLWNAGVRPTIPAPGDKLIAAKDLHISQMHEIAVKAVEALAKR